jgi:hypothetical protein
MLPCQTDSGLLEEDMAVTSISAVERSLSCPLVRWAFLHPESLKEYIHVFS